MWIGWVIAIIILIVLELFTAGFISIWFIASGVVALIISFFTDSFYIQFLVFGVLGIILLITTREKLNKWLNNKNLKKEMSRIIGSKGIVTITIKKNGLGKVDIEGKQYNATSDKRILKNQVIVVEKFEGDNLIVRKDINKKGS